MAALLVLSSARQAAVQIDAAARASE